MSLPGSPEKPYTPEQRAFLARQAASVSRLEKLHRSAGRVREAAQWKKVEVGYRNAATTGQG